MGDNVFVRDEPDPMLTQQDVADLLQKGYAMLVAGKLAPQWHSFCSTLFEAGRKMERQATKPKDDAGESLQSIQRRAGVGAGEALRIQEAASPRAALVEAKPCTCPLERWSARHGDHAPECPSFSSAGAAVEDK